MNRHESSGACGSNATHNRMRLRAGDTVEEMAAMVHSTQHHIPQRRWLALSLLTSILAAIVVATALATQGPTAHAQTAPGAITVVKEIGMAIPPVTDWEFTWSDGGTPVPFTLPAAGGSITLPPFGPGTIAIIELPKAGWAPSASITSESGTPNSTGGSDSATVLLESSETVEVTFTNTPTAPPTGTITVSKDVIGAPPTTDWMLTSTSGATPIPFAIAPAGGLPPGPPFDGTGAFAPGTYTITELPKTGWTTDSTIASEIGGTPNSAASGATATVILEAGEDVAVTFTNTETSSSSGGSTPPPPPSAPVGTIIVIQNILGDPPLQDWHFDANGLANFHLPGPGGQRTFSLLPGPVTITQLTTPEGDPALPLGLQNAGELTVAAFTTAVEITSETGGVANSSAADATATINLEAKETVVVTFTSTNVPPPPPATPPSPPTSPPPATPPPPPPTTPDPDSDVGGIPSAPGATPDAATPSGLPNTGSGGIADTATSPFALALIALALTGLITTAALRVALRDSTAK